MMYTPSKRSPQRLSWKGQDTPPFMPSLSAAKPCGSLNDEHLEQNRSRHKMPSTTNNEASNDASIAQRMHLQVERRHSGFHAETSEFRSYSGGKPVWSR